MAAVLARHESVGINGDATDICRPAGFRTCQKHADAPEQHQRRRAPPKTEQQLGVSHVAGHATDALYVEHCCDVLADLILQQISSGFFLANISGAV